MLEFIRGWLLIWDIPVYVLGYEGGKQNCLDSQIYIAKAAFQFMREGILIAACPVREHSEINKTLNLCLNLFVWYYWDMIEISDSFTIHTIHLSDKQPLYEADILNSGAINMDLKKSIEKTLYVHKQYGAY